MVRKKLKPIKQTKPTEKQQPKATSNIYLSKQLHTNSPFSISKKCGKLQLLGMDPSQNKPWLVTNFW